jgi:hypothetical protein
MNARDLERAREIARSLPPLTEEQKRTLSLLLAPARKPQDGGRR